MAKELTDEEIYPYLDKIMPSEHHISIPAIKELLKAQQSYLLTVDWSTFYDTPKEFQEAYYRLRKSEYAGGVANNG